MLESTESNEPARSGKGIVIAFSAFAVLLIAVLGFFGYHALNQLEAIDAKVDALSAQTEEATDRSTRALERALKAEAASVAAAEGRLLAEEQSREAEEESRVAQEEAVEARQIAGIAIEEATKAKAEAERIRQEAEAEMTRLEEALGQVAETRRTALGLVMNLGSDYLKFDFDKSEIRPENRELLSRIAGILLTSNDYTVSVHGHTDDVGTQAYNQKLSEERAEAVRNYLIEAGLSEDIFTVKGFGKSQPLVKDTTEEARAKNRRVELGIVNTRIRYDRRAPKSDP